MRSRCMLAIVAALAVLPVAPGCDGDSTPADVHARQAFEEVTVRGRSLSDIGEHYFELGETYAGEGREQEALAAYARADWAFSHAGYLLGEQEFLLDVVRERIGEMRGRRMGDGGEPEPADFVVEEPALVEVIPAEE